MNITSGYRFVSGIQSRILERSANISESYIVIIAGEDELLQWPNVFFQEVQPLLLVLNLVHVNVAGWHVFIATRQSWILPRNGIRTIKEFQRY